LTSGLVWYIINSYPLAAFLLFFYKTCDRRFVPLLRRSFGWAVKAGKAIGRARSRAASLENIFARECIQKILDKRVMNMDDLSRSVLTLDGLIQLRGDEIRRRGTEDGKVRTLMDLENAYKSNELEDYSLHQWSKYPPFRGWDD